MDEYTTERIVERTKYIRESLIILADIRDEASFATYRTDRRTRDIVEREFQTTIEACLDIGTMILRAKDQSVPETNAAVFRQLAAAGVVDDELGRRMSEAAGFRNILAHQYGSEIDDRDVYNVLQHDLDVFSTYLQQIRAALD